MLPSSTLLRGALAAIVALVALGGCATLRALDPPPYPGRTVSFEVAHVSMRDVYLDAELTGDRESLRLFLPDTETCRRLLGGAGPVAFVEDGPVGVLRRGAESCEAVGTGSLAAWRDRRPRPVGAFSPRSQASFTVTYEDMDLALARGRFPLAGLVGWTGGIDTIAAVPRTEACRAALENGVASMEYSPIGDAPFWLVAARGRCPVVGLLRPSTPRL